MPAPFPGDRFKRSLTRTGYCGFGIELYENELPFVVREDVHLHVLTTGQAIGVSLFRCIRSVEGQRVGEVGGGHPLGFGGCPDSVGEQFNCALACGVRVGPLAREVQHRKR